MLVSPGVFKMRSCNSISSLPEAFQIGEMLEELETSDHFQQASMSQRAWGAFLASPLRELQDRMIHALAISRSADAIITNDDEIYSI